MVRFICQDCTKACLTSHVRRWVFIFDGIITLVVAVYGFIFFPDTPHKTKAFYLSAEEKARCVERLVEDGRQEETKFSLDLFKRTMNTWQLYVLTVLWWYVPITQTSTPPADPFSVFGTPRLARSETQSHSCFSRAIQTANGLSMMCDLAIYFKLPVPANLHPRSTTSPPPSTASTSSCYSCSTHTSTPPATA
jgi:hypothetical protein